MSTQPAINPVLKFPKPTVECFHGGQSFRQCPNYKCDFSVSTNISGPPPAAVEAARKAFIELEHYPEQDAWVPRCHLANALGIHPLQILIGNGSSELIDVLFRVFPPMTTFREGPSDIQYMEYVRAALTAGLTEVPFEDKQAALTIIVNPNSPTGNYLELNKLREMIKNDDKSIFIIDESFLPCMGPNWKNESSINLIDEFPDRVIVITSWTKVYACPLLRIGSVISTKNMIARIAKLQAPWTVNGFAQSFFVTALHQEHYFDEMWKVTPVIKAEMIKKLKELNLKPNEESPLWVPYVYVDMHTKEMAELAEKVAFDAGLPVRSCKSYGKPAFLRLAIRKIEFFNQLLDAWKANKELMEMIQALSLIHI